MGLRQQRTEERPLRDCGRRPRVPSGKGMDRAQQGLRKERQGKTPRSRALRLQGLGLRRPLLRRTARKLVPHRQLGGIINEE